jgi:hypothetical protein
MPPKYNGLATSRVAIAGVMVERTDASAAP